MDFNIVDVETGVLVRYRNRLLQFATPEEATAKAKELGVNLAPRKFKIKAVAQDDSAWIAREQKRVAEGIYVPVPFATTMWYQVAVGLYTKEALRNYGYESRNYGYESMYPLIGIAKTHFAHVSMTSKTMLSYTESSEKGARDVQTLIKPGTYLAKYFGSYLNANAIQSIVNDWQYKYQDCELKFARTPEEIVEVYINGPRSCMAGRAEEYSTKTKGEYIHPCMVYGQPHSDLTLAYLEGKNGISARCLVWEEKKRYGRIYGDPTLLQRELENLGYTRAAFDGAKLGKIKVGAPRHNLYAMPYVDDWSNCVEMPDHFLLTRQSPARRSQWRSCCNTNGTTDGEVTYTCAHCEDEVDSVDTVDGENYCLSCRDELFIWCDLFGRFAPREGAETVVVQRVAGRRNVAWMERHWCAEAIEQYAFMCPVEKVYFTNSLKAKAPDGTTISQRAYERLNPPPAPTPDPAPLQANAPMTTADAIQQYYSGITPSYSASLINDLVLNRRR
jgi:hypothetical protein